MFLRNYIMIQYYIVFPHDSLHLSPHVSTFFPPIFVAPPRLRHRGEVNDHCASCNDGWELKGTKCEAVSMGDFNGINSCNYR